MDSVPALLCNGEVGIKGPVTCGGVIPGAGSGGGSCGILEPPEPSPVLAHADAGFPGSAPRPRL